MECQWGTRVSGPGGPEGRSKVPILLNPWNLMSTPMLQQIAGLKREAGEAVLLTRMGDFYEILGEDAVRAAPVLEIALTLRGKGSDAETPICGVPHFALESYLPKLLAAGFSAAIAEPTAKAEDVKSLLPRG